MDEVDKWFNEALWVSKGFSILPRWMAVAIETKNPRMTLGLASSKEYRYNKIDKELSTAPFVPNIKVEVN
jgi:hypothetical protein